MPISSCKSPSCGISFMASAPNAPCGCSTKWNWGWRNWNPPRPRTRSPPSRPPRAPPIVVAFTRRRPSRQPFPTHLPRERVVESAPAACLCCGGARLRKLGENITETLEVIPRSWKVIQHVREKFTCRDCEAISQPPAPFHVTPRGWAGPSLLAMILFEKFGQHQPLNRQAERYAREGGAAKPVHPGRSGGCLHRGADAAVRAAAGPCDGSRTAAWRRHDNSSTRPRQDRCRTRLGLCAR